MSRRAGLGALEPDIGAAAREDERRERRRREYRPPMWDTKTHGKPAGRFGRSPLESGADAETRRVLGPSNAKKPVSADAAAPFEEAWRKMRAAAVSKREHHHAEGATVLDAFKRVELERDDPTGRRPVSTRRGEADKLRDAGKCSPAEFKRAWFSLGVRDLTDAQVEAVFSKIGHDALGNMPYEVFTKALYLKQGRVLGLERIRKGPFEDADDARFLGKIKYPQCRSGVLSPSDWLQNDRGARAALRSSTFPTLDLKLDFAHGFPGGAACSSLGNALHSSKTNRLVYYVGALGIVYDARTHAQRFFRGHTDDVRSIAMHPDGETFATGQDGHNAMACVWSSTRNSHGNIARACDECALLARVVEPLGFCRAFIAVAFAPDGEDLLTVGSDEKHTVFLWDWKKHRVGETRDADAKHDDAKHADALCVPSSTMPGIQAAVPAVWGAAFNPRRRFAPAVKTLEAAANARTVSSQKPFAAGVAAFGPVAPLGGKPHSSVVSTANRGGGSFEFVTFGSKHVKLWRRDGAGAWNGRALRFGEAAPFSTRAAVFLPGGNLLVGNDDGTLAVFDLEKRCVKRIVRGFAHQTARTAPSESRGAGPNAKRPSGDRARGVGALVLLEDEKTVVSAGADGRIVAWRLTASLDDVEDTPYEEIQLQNPRGPNAPPPRIRSLAVVVDAPPPLVATTSSGGTVSGAVSGAVSGSPRRPRAADPPWGVDGDVEPPPQGRFPTKPREAIPWALALEDEGRAAFQESRAEGVSLSGARSSGASARRMSDLFSRVSCFAGTTACDLWEVSAIRARVRIAGASGTVDCVAWNPDFPVCATLGSDGSVRLFDARRRAHVGAKDVGRGSPGRSLSFSGDGKLLAAGFADGRIAVLRARTLESVAETAPVARDRRGKTPGWSETTLAGNNRVETVAFSPDSVYLAAGGGDGVVRLYANISGSFGLLETFAGHSCTVRALDWSKDGCVLRSQCVGGELLHWKPSSRTREGFSSVAAVNRRGEGHRGLPYSGDARDIQWHTHSSTVGFPVMGVWEAGKASSRIVDALDRSPDERFIVVGDDAGDIRVLNYPCVVRSAPGRKLAAHGARVGAVAFSLDGEWVASAGTADQTLIVWRTQAEERGR